MCDRRLLLRSLHKSVGDDLVASVVRVDVAESDMSQCQRPVVEQGIDIYDRYPERGAYAGYEVVQSSIGRIAEGATVYNSVRAKERSVYRRFKWATGAVEGIVVGLATGLALKQLEQCLNLFWSQQTPMIVAPDILSKIEGQPFSADSPFGCQTPLEITPEALQAVDVAPLPIAERLAVVHKPVDVAPRCDARVAG